MLCSIKSLSSTWAKPCVIMMHCTYCLLGVEPVCFYPMSSVHQLKLLCPALASSSNCQWLYPITFGGGLVEGDNITLEVETGPGCCVLVTTQSSTKVGTNIIWIVQCGACLI